MHLSLLLLAGLTCFPTVSSAAPENPCKTIENSVAVYNTKSKEFEGCRMTDVAADSLLGKMGTKVGDIVYPANYPVKVGPKKSVQLKAQIQDTGPQTESANKREE